MGKGNTLLGRIWHFIWEEDSVLSWIVNIVLAFILIKFIVYPGLGWALGTQYPIVAVVSSSMEHHPGDFPGWWSNSGNWYIEHGITQEQFLSFPLRNGFNKGDIILLRGGKPSTAKLGQVMVFLSSRQYPKPDPIIHRIVKITSTPDGRYQFQTKGDNNMDSIPNSCSEGTCIDEYGIGQEQVIGYAVLRVPYLGYVKIWAVELFNFISGGIKNVLP